MRGLERRSNEERRERVFTFLTLIHNGDKNHLMSWAWEAWGTQWELGSYAARVGELHIVTALHAIPTSLARAFTLLYFYWLCKTQNGIIFGNYAGQIVGFGDAGCTPCAATMSIFGLAAWLQSISGLVLCVSLVKPRRQDLCVHIILLILVVVAACSKSGDHMAGKASGQIAQFYAVVSFYHNGHKVLQLICLSSQLLVMSWCCWS